MNIMPNLKIKMPRKTGVNPTISRFNGFDKAKMFFRQAIRSFTVVATLSFTAIFSMSTFAVTIIDEENQKAVGNVRWQKHLEINADTLIDKAVPEDSVSLFFIRRYDDDDIYTSANIAINDYFHVSLNPGNYTQVYSCVGINRISAEATKFKTNDLLKDMYSYTLEGGHPYFFYVDVDTMGYSEIQQITEDSAREILTHKNFQSHQISRVRPNCITPEPVATPIQHPAPTVEETAPILAEKVSMEVEVLFDNDKAIIKPQYFDPVKRIADFMTTYPNTIATIEGHTDSNGSDDYNQQLSQSRADAVKLMLHVQYGIDSERLSAIGYGESQPRTDNVTFEGQQQNRRVIAVIEERP